MLGCELYLYLRGHEHMETLGAVNMVKEISMDKQLEQQMIADEIERLRLWDERVAREKEANDKEAEELAILIAEERKRPTDAERIAALESAMLDMILGGA